MDTMCRALGVGDWEGFGLALCNLDIKVLPTSRNRNNNDSNLSRDLLHLCYRGPCAYYILRSKCTQQQKFH